MKNNIFYPIFVSSIILVLIAVLIEQRYSKLVTTNENFLRNEILKFHSRDTLLLKIQENSNEYIDLFQNFRIEGISDLNFILVIPESTCIACYDDYFNRLFDMVNRKNIPLQIFCDIYTAKDLLIKSSSYSLIDVNSIFEDTLISNLKPNLLFFIYNHEKQNIIPYIEVKDYDLFLAYVSESI